MARSTRTNTLLILITLCASYVVEMGATPHGQGLVGQSLSTGNNCEAVTVLSQETDTMNQAVLVDATHTAIQSFTLEDVTDLKSVSVKISRRVAEDEDSQDVVDGTVDVSIVSFENAIPSNMPAGDVLATASVPVSELSDEAHWVDFMFEAVSLPAGQALSFQINSQRNIQVSTQSGSDFSEGVVYAKTTRQSPLPPKWTVKDTADLVFRLSACKSAEGDEEASGDSEMCLGFHYELDQPVSDAQICFGGNTVVGQSWSPPVAGVLVSANIAIASDTAGTCESSDLKCETEHSAAVQKSDGGRVLLQDGETLKQTFFVDVAETINDVSIVIEATGSEVSVNCTANVVVSGPNGSATAVVDGADFVSDGAETVFALSSPLSLSPYKRYSLSVVPSGCDAVHITTSPVPHYNATVQEAGLELSVSRLSSDEWVNHTLPAISGANSTWSDAYSKGEMSLSDASGNVTETVQGVDLFFNVGACSYTLYPEGTVSMNGSYIALGVYRSDPNGQIHGPALGQAELSGSDVNANGTTAFVFEQSIDVDWDAKLIFVLTSDGSFMLNHSSVALDVEEKELIDGGSLASAVRGEDFASVDGAAGIQVAFCDEAPESEEGCSAATTSAENAAETSSAHVDISGDVSAIQVVTPTETGKLAWVKLPQLSSNGTVGPLSVRVVRVDPSSGDPLVEEALASEVVEPALAVGGTFTFPSSGSPLIQQGVPIGIAVSSLNSGSDGHYDWSVSEGDSYTGGELVLHSLEDNAVEPTNGFDADFQLGVCPFSVKDSGLRASVALSQEEWESYYTVVPNGGAAQTFTVNANGFLTRSTVIVTWNRDGGRLEDLVVDIVTLDGATGTPTGKVIATARVDPSHIGNLQADWLDVYFDNAPFVRRGEELAIRLTSYDSALSAHYSWSVWSLCDSSFCDAYRGGDFWYQSELNGAWIHQDATDAAFKIHIA